MEDKTYIEALMSAPARPEHDYTAQEAAAQRMADFKVAGEYISKLITKAWEGIKRALTPFISALRRLILRLVRHFKPFLPRKYKVRARPRSISTRRAAVYQRKMARLTL
jgi:hypothetical protein